MAMVTKALDSNVVVKTLRSDQNPKAVLGASYSIDSFIRVVAAGEAGNLRFLEVLCLGGT